MSRSDNWQGEPRDLHEWLTVEESRACEALGRHMLSRGLAYDDAMRRTLRLTAVVEAIRAVNDRPLAPGSTLRGLALALSSTVDKDPTNRDAADFLRDVETILDWQADG